MSLNDKQRIQAQALFKQFDTDKSGSISASEVQAMLQKFGLNLPMSQVSNLVKSLDADKSGELNMSEFLILIQKALSQPSSSSPPAESAKSSGLKEKDLQKIRELFKQFDKESDGTIRVSDVQNMLFKFGINLTKSEVSNLVKAVDTENSGILDFEEFCTLVQKAVSLPTATAVDDDDLSGKDASALISRRINGSLFKLLKKLWSRASDPSELKLIRNNYGVRKLVKALPLRNPVACKGVTAVLLYLSLADQKEDFMIDDFYDNLIIALNDQDNEPNYLWLARLLRLLQTDKEFGDWMLARTDVPRDNRAWKRLYEITQQHAADSEELRKETSRAVKEGMRTGAPEGKYCIIPEKVVDRLKKEVIWRITDEDIAQLDELAANTDDADESTPPPPTSPESPAPLRSRAGSSVFDDRSGSLGDRSGSLGGDEARAKKEARIQKLLDERDAVEKEYTTRLQALIDELAKEIRSLRVSNGTKLTAIAELQREVIELKERIDTDVRDNIRTIQTSLLKSVSDTYTAAAAAATATSTTTPAGGAGPPPPLLLPPPSPTYNANINNTIFNPNPNNPNSISNILYQTTNSIPLYSSCSSLSSYSYGGGGGGGGGSGSGSSSGQYPFAPPISGKVPSSSSSSSNSDKNSPSGSPRYVPPPLSSSSYTTGVTSSTSFPPVQYDYGGGGEGGGAVGRGANGGRGGYLGASQSGGYGSGGGSDDRGYLVRSMSTSSRRSSTYSPGPPPVELMPLPPGWEKKLDSRTGRYYYFERATRQTQWKPPS